MCFRGSPGSTRTTIETASRQKLRVESAVSAPAFRMPLMCSDMSADPKRRLAFPPAPAFARFARETCRPMPARANRRHRGPSDAV